LIISYFNIDLFLEIGKGTKENPYIIVLLNDPKEILRFSKVKCCGEIRNCQGKRIELFKCENFIISNCTSRSITIANSQHNQITQNNSLRSITIKVQTLQQNILELSLCMKVVYMLLFQDRWQQNKRHP